MILDFYFKGSSQCVSGVFDEEAEGVMVEMVIRTPEKVMRVDWRLCQPPRCACWAIRIGYAVHFGSMWLWQLTPLSISGVERKQVGKGPILRPRERQSSHAERV